MSRPRQPGKCSCGEQKECESSNPLVFPILGLGGLLKPVARWTSVDLLHCGSPGARLGGDLDELPVELHGKVAQNSWATAMQNVDGAVQGMQTDRPLRQVILAFLVFVPTGLVFLLAGEAGSAEFSFGLTCLGLAVTCIVAGPVIRVLSQRFNDSVDQQIRDTAERWNQVWENRTGDGAAAQLFYDAPRNGACETSDDQNWSSERRMILSVVGVGVAPELQERPITQGVSVIQEEADADQV
mmetsp:Transcript_32904/g.71794  ORF Transcript_32904/g.71794 Transcript_32904/m.71794 type:complete len:241 (+) Transcript_32904:753-1475(+)